MIENLAYFEPHYRNAQLYRKFSIYLSITSNIVQRLPDDIIHRILIRLSSSESCLHIARAVGVANKTVYRIERNIDL